MEIKTFLPVFHGFYGSIFEDENLDGEHEHYNLPKNFDLSDFIDWQKRYLNLSKQFCNIIENEMSDFIDSVTFESLYSPREYNFTNDSINCLISPKIDAIKSYIYDNKEAFCSYLEDRFKSRSGFISFYGYTFEQWKTYTKDFSDYTEDSIYLGSVLDFIGTNEEINDFTLYEKLQDFHISQFYTDEFYQTPEILEHYKKENN